ncbi:MAG: BON domain-containing protein [Holophagaceae bacterium]|nr:BON domain-containing protein [Holophagaceae bacterium]
MTNPNALATLGGALTLLLASGLALPAATPATRMPAAALAALDLDARFESAAHRVSETDDRIEASAKNSYNFRTYLKNDDIKVSSSRGVVTLTGTVSHGYHKSLAQETVAELPGVKSVDNQLTLVGEQPADNSDGWITMKVKATLAFHKNVEATSTEVHTEKGVVTLTGTAYSGAQKDLTAEYAKDVEGVTEVRNNLVIAGHNKSHRTFGEKVDDSSITAQLKSALLFHKSTRPLATKVRTRNGVVTLEGEAKNQMEKDMVTRVAADIKGVRSVRNKMSVRPS